MKKIIDRKTYDTETATLLAESENQSAFQNDFEYWEEKLYRTPKGAYFIAGSGGAYSRYGRSEGGSTMSGGVGLRLVSRDEAIQWLENNDQVDVLEAEFQDEIEEA